MVRDRLLHSSLEALPLDLRLGRGDGGLPVGVDEPAPVLAVLELRRLGRADAHPTGVRAARRRAVRVVHAPARDELGPVALPDVASPGVVGGDLREAGNGDYKSSTVSSRRALSLVNVA